MSRAGRGGRGGARRGARGGGRGGRGRARPVGGADNRPARDAARDPRPRDPAAAPVSDQVNVRGERSRPLRNLRRQSRPQDPRQAAGGRPLSVERAGVRRDISRDSSASTGDSSLERSHGPYRGRQGDNQPREPARVFERESFSPTVDGSYSSRRERSLRAADPLSRVRKQSTDAGSSIYSDMSSEDPRADTDGSRQTKGSDDSMPADVIQQGWLTKSNPKGRYWKKRWCVLKADSLLYYKQRDHASEPGREKGKVDVSAANLLTGPGEKLSIAKCPTEHVFRLAEGRRVYYFCADDRSELTAWCGALLVTTSGGMYDDSGFSFD